MSVEWKKPPRPSHVVSMKPMESSTSVSPSHRPTVSPRYVISKCASGECLRPSVGITRYSPYPPPGIAPHIEKGDVVLRLVDASGWALSRDSERLAGHDRVIFSEWSSPSLHRSR